LRDQCGPIFSFSFATITYRPDLDSVDQSEHAREANQDIDGNHRKEEGDGQQGRFGGQLHPALDEQPHVGTNQGRKGHKNGSNHQLGVVQQELFLAHENRQGNDGRTSVRDDEPRNQILESLLERFCFAKGLAH